MRLTYIYHSGFAIEADEFAILIDYYKDTGGYIICIVIPFPSGSFQSGGFEMENIQKRYRLSFRQRYFEKEPGRERRCDLSQKRRFL